MVNLYCSSNFNAEAYIFQHDEKTRRYCEEVLNETPESRTEALAELRQWSAQQPQYHIDTSNTNLLAFLRGCKFNLEKTKQKLTNFAILRRDNPEWFSNRNPHLPEIQELVKLGVFVPLKRTLNNERLVVIIRTAAHDPKKHKQDDIFKVGKMLLDVACMLNERAHIYGVTAIFDMKGVTLGHARQLTPSIIKRAVNVWQNHHCRPKNLEFINAPSYVNVVLSVFKSFMSEKLRKRVRVHYRGCEGIYDLVDKEILPPQYGGNGESLAELIEYWQTEWVQFTSWFEEDEKYKADKDNV